MVVAALHSPRRLACRLHGRQQQRNQNADDRDDHQQFDQGKTVTASERIHRFNLMKATYPNCFSFVHKAHEGAPSQGHHVLRASSWTAVVLSPFLPRIGQQTCQSGEHQCNGRRFRDGHVADAVIPSAEAPAAEIHPTPIIDVHGEGAVRDRHLAQQSLPLIYRAVESIARRRPLVMSYVTSGLPEMAAWIFHAAPSSTSLETQYCT